MEALILLAAAAAGWAFAAHAQISATKERAAVAARHAQELARKDERIDTLIAQVQLNAQHMPYYPTIGPSEPLPERKYLHSDDGFVTIDVTDDVLDEVAR